MATAAKDPRRAVQTPEVMRRRLSVVLRRAREKKPLTQREAAEALYWSVSKIIRIEQGAVAITPTDLQAMLAIYGVNDERQVSELVELALASRRQDWAAYKDVYSQASLGLFGSEPAAKTIYKYEPTFIPGLLQTPTYAHALLTGLGRSEEEIEPMVNARLQRQELLDREVRPELRFILGEAAVSRAVGGPRVMIEQLDRIKQLGARHRISLQLLPFSAGAHPTMGGAFTILEFEDEHLDDLLYLENAGGVTTTRDDKDLIAKYREVFLKLEGMATKPDDLASVLDEIAAARFKDTADPPTTSSAPAEQVD